MILRTYLMEASLPHPISLTYLSQFPTHLTTDQAAQNSAAPLSSLSSWTNTLSALKVSPSRQQLAEHVYTRTVPNSRSDGASSSLSPVAALGGLRKGRSEGRICSSHWTGPRQ